MAGPVKISSAFKEEAEKNIGRINYLGVAKREAEPGVQPQTVAVFEHYHIDKRGNVVPVKDMIDASQIGELLERTKDHNLPWTEHNKASFNEALDVIKDVDQHHTPLQTISDANHFDQIGAILQTAPSKTLEALAPTTFK